MTAARPRPFGLASPRAAARALFTALALASAAAPSAAESLRVVGAALVSDGAETRLSLRVNGAAAAVAPRVFTLDAPPRLVVDLPGLTWFATPPPAAGLALRARAGVAAPGVARVVLDLAGPARLVAVLAGGRDEIVLRLAPEEPERFRHGAGWPTDAPRPSVAGDAPPAPAPHIVLDPGHGGVDPGAVRGGLREKDVALDFARTLATLLGARGWRVALTREADVFVPLADRPALAQALGADAFLSIHADTVLEGDAFGASVYVLSDAASDAQAAALAERENAVDRLGGLGLSAADADVAQALAALVRAPTRARSRALGAALLEGLEGRAPVLASAPLRGAAFRVLKAPDVPSALLELGFLSNAGDRARLGDPAWRAATARAVADALDAWSAAR